MDFYMKLPRNKKELGLFMLIVSIISVNILAPLITCFEVGFSVEVYVGVLKVIVFIWLAVIALVILTYVPAEKLTKVFTKEGDSFRAVVIVNILVTVTMLSVLLTVIGTWIGTRSVTLEPIVHFFYKWPRNYALAFFVESCIAQPIARGVLYLLHKRIDKKHAPEKSSEDKQAD
ncbi:MAG: hypothetical protein IJ735_01575 [Clostridia bacterium]|nr:hypothetical protein [Clostridia bacterium]